MLAKCANPACGARFLYLHQGRIFNFPFSDGGKDVARVEHYWLCDSCVASLTVVMRNGQATVQFRHAELTDGLKRNPPRQRTADAA